MKAEIGVFSLNTGRTHIETIETSPLLVRFARAKHSLVEAYRRIYVRIRNLNARRIRSLPAMKTRMAK